MSFREEVEVGGKALIIESGRLAGLADGAVTVRYGDTIVLATAVASKSPREGIDFFPLTVDFEEKLYAAGKIPGGFIKREGRPTEHSILASRLTDRPLRPLFPQRLPQRRADRDQCALGRSGERSCGAWYLRCLCGVDDFGYPVQRTCGCRTSGLHQRFVRYQPDRE